MELSIKKYNGLIKLEFNYYQGCSCIQTSIQTAHPTNFLHKPHVHLIRKYSSIFEHIQVYSRYFQKIIYRICPLCTMLKGQKDMSIHPSYPFRTFDHLWMSNLTTLVITSNFKSNFHIFSSRCVIIFVMIYQNQLKFGILANWQHLFPSIQIHPTKKTRKNSKFYLRNKS